MIDLNSLSEEEYLEVLSTHYFIPTAFGTLQERLQIINILMAHFNLDKNREQIAFILCNYPRIIAEACAGSGKTSSCILKVLTHCLFKDIEAEKTIMLTYTSEAAKDMSYKLESAYAKIRQLEFSNLELTGKIQVKTLHSFFTTLIYEYADNLNIRVINKKLLVLNNSESLNYMKQVLTALETKGKLTAKITEALPSLLLQLYQQIKERDIMEVKEEWSKCSSFKSLTMLVFDELVKIYEVYEKFKRGSQAIEFCEYAKISSQLFENPKILERWQRLYKYVVVDEYQDVTESQVKVIKQLMVGTKGTILVAIGDGDQSIYGFRGAHANGCVEFPTEFSVDGSKVCTCTMTLNRRCPKNILNKARDIIETVNVRLDKKLNTDIQGGNFEIKHTKDYKDEAYAILKIVNEMSDDELNNTVIAYRSNRSSRFVRKILEDSGIRVSSSNGVKDLFEETLKGAISLLADPSNIDLAEQFLYKMVPKGKGFGSFDIKKVLKAERLKRRSGYSQCDIFQLDFSDTNAPDSFFSSMKVLENISMAVQGKFVNKTHVNKMSYFVPPLVFNFLKKYHLGWQDAKSDTEGSDHIFEVGDTNTIIDEYAKNIYEEYTQDLTYEEFRRGQLLKKSNLDSSIRKVNFSTFHGLKGLEYQSVLVIDLRDSIFPGYELSQATKFGGHFISMADDEAKRLLYVVMTRSKSSLIMFFRDSEPSRYISYLRTSAIEGFSDTLDSIDLMFEDNSDLIWEGTSSEVLVTDEFKAFKKTTSLDRWLKQ